MSARNLVPRSIRSRTLATSLLVTACAAFGCSSPAPPGDVNSPYEPDIEEGAGGAATDDDAHMDYTDVGDGAAVDIDHDAATVTVCPAGETPCAGTCVDLQTDDTNCGACGSPCALGSCDEGTCG